MSGARGFEALPAFDPYAELGLSADADRAAVEAAYRALMKLHHPDVSRDPVAGEARGKRLNVARRWLTDPVLRRRYDEAHGLDRPPLVNDWEPPATTIDDLLRVRPDRATTRPAPPYGVLFAVGLMLALAALMMGFRSGLSVVGGAAGVALAIFGGVAMIGGSLTPPQPGRDARPARRLISFPALLIVGLVFLGSGALLVEISIWLLVFALPAMVVGLVLTLYGGIGVAIGVGLALRARTRG